MITLTLLNPVQLTPVQHWTFEDEAIVRIGRSPDNHVVLYSAVVSRYHVEIRRMNSNWTVVSLGTNGTYLGGERITEMPVHDGMMIRLAKSGPNLQIHLSPVANAQTLSGTGSPVSSSWEGLPRGIALDPVKESVPAQAAISLDQMLNPQCDSQTAMEPETMRIAPLRMQQVLGKYQVIKLLGQGNMGVTYLGSYDGQNVVLKTLNAEWVKHPPALKLFDQQAKALSFLSHPGIPQWRDCFAVEGQPYLVTDFVSGQTLFQYVVKRGKVDVPQAISWMLELCHILEYLHQQSPPMVHQEIRPENVIRRHEPTPLHELALVDFAAVRMLSVQSNTRMGCEGYLAPEQRRGQATWLSDLYAIGPMLVFLISGQEPSLFYQHWGQESRFCAELIPGLPSKLIEVIRHLTHPNPSDRYQSAGEVAIALREIV